MSLRPYCGHGIALRPAHTARFLEAPSAVDWVEVISERFLGAGDGARWTTLERLRRSVPVALHGTTLSIGSADPLRLPYLRRLKELVDRVEPVWVSDHLAWSSFGGDELELLPLPYTDEVLQHVVRRVQAVQEVLGRRILLENPSSYLAFRGSTLREWEFLAAVAREADCGILLDVNNVYVSARNHGFDPSQYLAGLPTDRVAEIHLAGHRDVGDLLLDTHEGPVPASVWAIYEEALRRFGEVSTIVEWDTGDPTLTDLLAERDRAARAAEELWRAAA